jgi:DNA repair protein SbcD/Mre11
MKYAHLADLHLGSWREEKMRNLSTKAFLQAMDLCVQEQVDFILFAGDIFNTALPSLDILKLVTKKLKALKDLNLPVFVIAGSHDFSPSGKTMIDVLENAGLVTNVCKGEVKEKELHLKFTIEEKTGAKLCGILGRKGQLDSAYYENLAREPLETEAGYKIFMFHTTVSEMKPKHLEKMESHPVSFLPKGFNYYAGGHIHHRTEVNIPQYGKLTYPGALFPNNFSEVEKYSHGGFFIIEAGEGENIQWHPVNIIKHLPQKIDCTGFKAELVHNNILQHLRQQQIENSLITLRLSGRLQGRISDINMQEVYHELYQRGAYFIMKNATELQSNSFEEIKIENSNPEVMEDNLIRQHLQQIKLFNSEHEFHITKSLLSTLNTNKKEGETITDFTARVCQDLEKLFATH